MTAPDRRGWCSAFKANRRFELARLLGDRFVGAAGDRLHPATRALTFRQKWQRAFAAELLCPFDGLAEVLEGDLSDEGIESAAGRFGVSELAVRMVLVSHGLLERGDGLSAASAA
jgi:Zn-dependent peptidase ImmA (M78 family)